MDILLIDDEPAVCEPIAMHLKGEGHDVRTATSGEHGLWMLQDRPADLVITDIKMPWLSGIEVLRDVRERWPATEVVLITGYGTMDDAVEALRLGAYDFLLKPVRLARLEVLVRHCEDRICFSRDNRELREVVERLRELSERKEKFIALANHEIRTPTTVAAGLVSLLADRADELPEDARRLVHGADQSLRRLKEVVEDLGDLGLTRGGRVRLHPLDENLDEIVEGIEALCSMYRSVRDLQVRVSRSTHRDRTVRVDRRRLLRAVGALVQNAVKYTPDGGEVTVEVREDGEDLVFEVSDTGVGVSEEERDKIFDLFYEAGEVRHHKTSGYEFGGGGLGVGLPLAQAIAHAHAGSVDYRPRAPGRGSVFTVRIPSAPDG
jgi:signal transduction histidine kinase